MIIEGTLADTNGVWRGQIRIVGERIAEVATHHRIGPADVVFGESCLIFAGMGDIHIHAREDPTRRDCHKETFATASAAALSGGVVHVADMPNNPAAPVDDASYAAKQECLTQSLAAAQATGTDAPGVAAHITLYAGIGPGTRPLSRPVPYKAYMGPSVGELYFARLEDLDTTLAAYRGCAVSFHCEDPATLEAHATAPTHEQRRPPQAELLATAFALRLIERHGLTGKLCHYSVGEGLTLIRSARAGGLPVTIEVTPHHLYFDESAITETNRPWLQMNPPLRSAADRAAMLDALRDGTIDYLASDHAPHTRDEKLAGVGTRGVSGQPHLDTYGAFVCWLLDHAGLTPQRVAQVCSANPGAFVAPYSPHQFGRLQPGYAASVTVLNRARPWTVQAADLATRCGWSPFEGHTLPGSVEAVWHLGRRVPLTRR